MNDSLATYLSDHLAGAVHAIELLKAMRDQYKDQPLGRFAASLLVEIEADRDTLQSIAERAGSGSSSIKEATAWMGEKISRFKLRHGDANALGTFEALEFLKLGIHGKWLLWRVLAIASANNPRLQGINFEELTTRAEKQQSEVEIQRLEIAKIALSPVQERG